MLVFYRTMAGQSRIIFIFLALIMHFRLCGQDVYKFERLAGMEGLSQNNVESILCDDKGFLWFGTWDGLNRYDGRHFKFFRLNPDQKNTLTNNRIIDLWQDKQKKLWAKTHDGYIHYFIEPSQEFITYPSYLKSFEEKKSTISCITETDHKELLLGSTNSGLYYLTYDEHKGRYTDRQFVKEHHSLSDNAISLITDDANGDFWIATKHGVNHVTRAELNKVKPAFSTYWLGHNFTAGYCLDSILVFGTERHGIKIFETDTRKAEDQPDLFRDLSTQTITVIDRPYKNALVVGTKSSGLFVYDLKKRNVLAHLLEGKEIKKIYRDLYHTLWVNTQEFGIYSVDSTFRNLKHYILVPPERQMVIDDERQFIYEDSNKNFWIALHAGGLAHFDRSRQKFDFYRHTLNDNTTISSDYVYRITEDQSGLLWVGTGGFGGGVNKIYTTNDAFQRVRLEEKSITGNENHVRSILVDNNGYTWVGTKGTTTYILDKEYKIVTKYHKIPMATGLHPGHNAYSIIQDKEGYIWIGTKGGGIFVSEKSLDKINYDYQSLRFINYTHDPKDSLSLSSNLVFTIFQDSRNRIWIGTYGGGLNLVTGRTRAGLICTRFNQSNSRLSSNRVRYITEDNDGRLWIATTFGLNHIDLSTLNDHPTAISTQLYDPRHQSGLTYNDVVHLFNDSNNHLWIGTFGGGVNKLSAIRKDSATFLHLTSKDGLINDVVYAMLEDQTGHIWFSTDSGISRYNPIDGTFDNFDQSNNLGASAFTENTCSKAHDGNLLFGTNEGLLLVKPELIQKNNYMPPVVLTNFQLFNKDVNINDSSSPVKQDIETLNEIILNYDQSSFSIEYAALSYFAPTKNKYAFMLENFDKTWNEVGNQGKATYTNLPPGNYVFKVKAANWNSGWSDKMRTIKIIILPPWWRTSTMYIIYAIVLSAAVEIVRRSYVRYHKLQNDLKVERRVNDIKLQFFTNISHEIRTPLTLILGPIQDIIDAKDVSYDIKSRLHLVEKNGKRMLRLVNQLLDFRKVQQNKMKLKVQRINLISFLGSIIENFSLIAEHKNLTIEFNPRQEPLEVWVDPNKFDSVIFNVLSNALKFSPNAGKVNIAVSAHPDNYIDIAISDQGSGIPKNRINLIFQRFSPLSQENEQFGSSGIGLALSYQIMKLHHGDIVVKSEPNKGSVFTIRLQAGCEHFEEEEIVFEQTELLYKIPHENAAEHEDAVPEISETPSENKKNHVLIVEDNLQIVNYLKESLKKSYSISTALNGREALESIGEREPDILITDVMMPEMNGIELTQKLKSSIDTSHIPVIMLTAKSSIEDQIEGIESGAEAYILKPFSMAYVHALISTLIRQRKVIQRKYIQNLNDGTLQLKITTKDEKFLHDVNQLIMANYSDPEFNIEKLAEISYVSRTVFYNKIKSLTGLTPIDFLRQKRLHIASQLILETDYSVLEIATMTGFNDVKNFSKRFKEIYKFTPTQYKQQLVNR